MTRRAFVVACAVSVAAACTGTVAQEDDIYSPKLRIAWEEFKPLYEQDKVVVVDVRDRAGFDSGHIPKARSIPLDEVEKHVAELKKAKKPIVTYCA
jgi:predicted sulfurtransferase